MLPEYLKEFQTELEMEELPSRDFKLNIQSETVTGEVDGIDAIRQTVFMILSSERYQYEIYDWDYGVEFKDLYGEPVTYCCPEIERRIVEALLMDDRIIEIDNFEFDYSRRGIIATEFTVHSILGAIDYTIEVEI